MFWEQLYKSFKQTGGYVLTAVGVIFSVLAFVFDHDSLRVNPALVAIIIVVVVFLIAIIITLYDLSRYFYKKSLNNSPRVLKTIKQKEMPILLTEYSDLLRIDGLVTIYRLNDEDFEEHIGYGEVINIQEDKKIQICFRKISIEQEKLSEIRKSIIIKPYITRKTINL